jgi:putative transposase
MVKNHKLAKSISDAAWDRFAQWLEYLGKIYGKTVVAVAPEYTSQDCSNCGNLVKKTLSTRTHICGCGVILYPDRNASLNILAKGLKQAGINSNTAEHAEINAWEQTDLYYEGGDINEQINWPNQESPRVHAPGVSTHRETGVFRTCPPSSLCGMICTGLIPLRLVIKQPFELQVSQPCRSELVNAVPQQTSDRRIRLRQFAYLSGTIEYASNSLSATAFKLP